MALFSFWRDRVVSRRVDEQRVYSAALREIEAGVRRDGLWAKAIADSNGDQERAKAKYIELVATALRDEGYITRRLSELSQQDEARRAALLREQQDRITQEQSLQLQRENLLRDEETRRALRLQYESKGLRAKRIGWRLGLTAFAVGVLGFLLSGSELAVAVLMSMILVAPISGLLAYLVASLILRGVRFW